MRNSGNYTMICLLVPCREFLIPYHILVKIYLGVLANHSECDSNLNMLQRCSHKFSGHRPDTILFRASTWYNTLHAGLHKYSRDLIQWPASCIVQVKVNAEFYFFNSISWLFFNSLPFSWKFIDNFFIYAYN